MQCKPLTHPLSNSNSDDKDDLADEGEFIVTPNDRVFRESESSTPVIEQTSKLASPSSFHLTDSTPMTNETVKVEAAASILELNEKALAYFNAEEIEKAFLNFKKCQTMMSKPY